MKRQGLLPLICGAIAACLGTLSASAQSVADFYKTNQIRMIVRTEPGTSYDFYSRILSAHMSAHIPGNPTIVNVNMPGGGGIVAANYVGVVAPRDGTILSIIGLGLPVDQALKLHDSFKVDLRTLGWLGSIDSTNQVLVTWHTSKIKTLADAMQTQSLIGSTGAGSPTLQFPSFYNSFLGTKFKIVLGYKGAGEINLAMERGELDGSGSNAWEEYLIDDPQYVRDKLIIPLIQAGLHKESGLPDVPLLLDLAKTPEEKAAYLFLSNSVDFGHGIATTPGVPPERLAALRKAFEETMKDPAFIAEIKKGGGDVRPASAAETATIVRQLIETPQAVRDKVKAAFGDAG